jgi:hypothetical protein
MPSPVITDKRYFLNRIALEHDGDPLSLDPYWVLQQLYKDISLEEMQELFAEFCEAAIAPAYTWREKTPGSLLRFAEELEQMIEACFLLLSWMKTDNTVSKKSIGTSAQTIRQFFKTRNLPGWKSWLHRWTASALSSRSVAELVAAEELVPFVQWMEKLLVAAEVLSRENKKR